MKYGFFVNGDNQLYRYQTIIIFLCAFLIVQNIAQSNDSLSVEKPIQEIEQIEPPKNHLIDSLKNQKSKIEEVTKELESSNLFRNILIGTVMVGMALIIWLVWIHNKNLTLRKQLEMNSVNKLFTNFLDQSIEAFIVFDSFGQILLWNKANENMTGVKQEEALGQYIWDIAAKIKMLALNQAINQERIKQENFFKAMMSDPGFESKREELMIEKSASEIRTLMATYFPIKISTSTYFGIVMWDITERKEYEGQLIIAKEQAESSDRLKSEFLGQISHEIRTPVNTIVNHVSLLTSELHASCSEDVVQSINSINSASERLIRTIDLLINISAIHTGSFEMKPKHLNLYSDVALPCFQAYKTEAEQKGLAFNINTNCDDATLLVDEHSIKHIMSNLVSNAIIFTDSGSININVGMDDFRRLYFEVTDTGIGISEDFLPKIYEPFAQEEQGYTRRYEGNGLGLTLVKEYCELNDASVTVKSKKGVGTSFKVTFKKVDLKSILL